MRFASGGRKIGLDPRKFGQSARSALAACPGNVKTATPSADLTHNEPRVEELLGPVRDPKNRAPAQLPFA